MRFSIWPHLQQPWTEVAAVAAHTDATGWDGIWLADHFMGDAGGFGPVETPTLEATAGIAALAGSTSRLRLGSLVFGTTYRHPAVLANWAVTVDHISRGRLTLGIGAGWQENEHEQYGIDLPPLRARVDRFAETCQVLTSLLRERVTNLDGQWFRLSDAVCEPKPVQDPLPILIGAKGDRMLRLVARHADQWNLWSLPDLFAERSAALDAACAAIDRDPASITRSTQALIMLTDKPARAAEFVEMVAPRAAIAGTPEQVAEVVSRFAALGLDEFIVPDWILGQGNRRLDAIDALRDALVPALGAPRDGTNG